MAVQYMRRVIQRRAKFDIMDLNVVQVRFYNRISITEEPGNFFLINWTGTICYSYGH
jgi:hypothetical protein